MRIKFVNLASLVLFLYLQFSTSCKKDPPHSKVADCYGREVFYGTNPGLADAKFKTGTYWVFKDSITNLIDSNIVISAGTEFEKNYGCESWEYYRIGISRNGIETLDNQAYTIQQDYLFSHNAGAKIYLIPAIDDSSTGVVHQHIDSLLVNGTYYKNVLKITLQKDPTYGHKKTATYFNLDFGFLRVDEFDSINQLTNKKLLVRKLIIR